MRGCCLRMLQGAYQGRHLVQSLKLGAACSAREAKSDKQRAVAGDGRRGGIMDNGCRAVVALACQTTPSARSVRPPWCSHGNTMRVATSVQHPRHCWRCRRAQAAKPSAPATSAWPQARLQHSLWLACLIDDGGHALAAYDLHPASLALLAAARTGTTALPFSRACSH